MPKDVAGFLQQIARRPDDLVVVSRRIQPHNYEVSALLEQMDQEGRFATVLFEQPENLLGEPSEFALVSNVFGTRERIALAIGHPPADKRLGLSLEMARRERHPIPALPIEGQAPVQENVWEGEEADLRRLPTVLHYELDLSPVNTMTFVLKDPDEDFYDISFAKMFFKGDSHRAGISIHTPHLARILAKYEERGKRCPAVYVMGHHPAFYLGSLAATPFGNNDYDTVGAYLQEPLRLAPSVTWGEGFLVPADAEIIIEGEILPGERTVVDPFGEVTRVYQPQCLRQVFEVNAITSRRHAIMQNIFSGHRGHWLLGSIPKEGSIYNILQRRFGTIKAVHMPLSMCGRLGCYISMKKEREGDAKPVGHAALLESSFFQWIVVVDEDIDVYNESDVLWAIATYVDPSRDVDLVKNSYTLFNTAARYQKVVIDATRPLDVAFPQRFKVPDETMARMNFEEWIEYDTDILDRMPRMRDALVR